MQRIILTIAAVMVSSCTNVDVSGQMGSLNALRDLRFAEVDLQLSAVIDTALTAELNRHSGYIPLVQIIDARFVPPCAESWPDRLLAAN